MATPVAVTIAGSDSGGGAGIQADLKTFSALGVYGACVIAALTAQNTKGVFAVHQVPADFITAQIDAVFSDFAIGAVKIGMLGNRAAIEAVAAGIERHQARNVVLDPVMAATSGEKLLNSDALDMLRKLITHANILTPNLPEAAALLNELPARDEGEMLKQAERLLEFGADAVLIKGGHGSGPDSVDLSGRAGGLHPLFRATYRDQRRPRHRLLARLGHRRRPRQGLLARRGGGRGQDLRCRGSRRSRSARDRVRPPPGASFFQVVVEKMRPSGRPREGGGAVADFLRSPELRR